MKIKKIHNDAIMLMLEGQFTKREIAQQIGKSEKTLWNWEQDEDFQAAYDKARKEEERRNWARIHKMSKKALDVQEKIMDKSKNDIARASVAADVLDRAGYAPEQNVNVNAGAVVEIIDDINRQLTSDNR